MNSKIARTLLCKIAEKGGIYGAVAKLYAGTDEKVAHRFVMECYHQVHTPGANDMWGPELIAEIIDYKIRYGESAELLKKKYKLYSVCVG